eukprot:s233_g22.t1
MLTRLYIPRPQLSIWCSVKNFCKSEAHFVQDLEIAARESGNLEDLDEKCGTGLWDKLDLERQQFPTDKDEAFLGLRIEPATSNSKPLEPDTGEASNEATSLRQDDLQNPAMLQVRDLDVARQIRRHGFPM